MKKGGGGCTTLCEFHAPTSAPSVLRFLWLCSSGRSQRARSYAVERCRCALLGSCFLRPAFFQERALLQFRKGLAELLLRVHHDGAVPGNRLFEWFAGDEEEADAFVASLHDYFVAAIKEDQGAIVGG